MQTFEQQYREALRLLLLAERATGLLLRCQPLNAREEQARLSRLLGQGHYEAPRFVYAAPPNLGTLRADLGRIAASLRGGHPFAELYAQRCDELALEAALAEAVATPAFQSLAARRFAAQEHPAQEHPAQDQTAPSATQTAELWSSLEDEAADLPRLASDDTTRSGSLLNRMRHRVSQCRLSFRVEVRPMAAAAATGDGIIYVAPDRWLTTTESARIVEHEVCGHAFPRERASRETMALFAVGSAGGSDEQEGYALFLEREAGFLDAPRQRELGLRHLAALTVREGADWVDTVRRLQELATGDERAVAIASRVHRGGGLARELVYLPALARVEAAAKDDRTTLDWLARGRLSLDAIDTVRARGAAQGLQSKTVAF